MSSNVTLESVSKRFGDFHALNDVSLSIEGGSFVTILGPSGSGKTTTLRVIGGFETPDEGRVLLDGEDITFQPPEIRHVNTTFQGYALFPHMTVFENVAFGLRIKKVPGSEIGSRVSDALELIKLSGYGDRAVTHLSGGEKQRVALARAFVNRPKVLLLDEPLSALDLKLRRQMQVELKSIQKKLGITFVYVTHDQGEALSMSDRIVVMNKARVEQIGAPDEIYRAPRTAFVADFLGEANILEGKVLGTSNGDGRKKVEIAGHRFEAAAGQGLETLNGTPARFSLRPEDIVIGEGAAKMENSIDLRLSDVLFLGNAWEFMATADGVRLKCWIPAHRLKQAPTAGESVRVGWAASDMVVLQ